MERWSGRAKLAVVLETAALAEAEVGEYCRARRLFPEQVRSWPARQRIRELEKDLGRKDRALAETAALLILRKKAAVIWGEKD